MPLLTRNWSVNYETTASLTVNPPKLMEASLAVKSTGLHLLAGVY